MNVLDITELQGRLRDFADARDWGRFHTPKNLAMALSVEAGELVELYQWLTPDESCGAANEPKFKAALADELADVLIYLIRLADVVDIDLPSAVDEKLAKNERKHPPAVERSS